MFTGTWKESQESLIKLEIPDENIDEEGMHRDKLVHVILFLCISYRVLFSLHVSTRIMQK
jgi:hypothetical protein